MKITYREAARDDVIRQFHYYLVERNAPAIAIRFREAVKKTANFIGKQPGIAPALVLQNPQLKMLRSWPVTGFENIRMYFLLEQDAVRIIRILHSRRNVRAILEHESNFSNGERLIRKR